MIDTHIKMYVTANVRDQAIDEESRLKRNLNQNLKDF